MDSIRVKDREVVVKSGGWLTASCPCWMAKLDSKPQILEITVHEEGSHPCLSNHSIRICRLFLEKDPNQNSVERVDTVVRNDAISTKKVIVQTITTTVGRDVCQQLNAV